MIYLLTYPISHDGLWQEAITLVIGWYVMAMKLFMTHIAIFIKVNKL